jgi:hypothetical protein
MLILLIFWAYMLGSLQHIMHSSPGNVSCLHKALVDVFGHVFLTKFDHLYCIPPSFTIAMGWPGTNSSA